MFPVFEDQVRTVQPRPAVRGVPAECVRALLLPGERHAPADPRPRPQPRPRQAGPHLPRLQGDGATDHQAGRGRQEPGQEAHAGSVRSTRGGKQFVI